MLVCAHRKSWVTIDWYPWLRKHQTWKTHLSTKQNLAAKFCTYGAFSQGNCPFYCTVLSVVFRFKAGIPFKPSGHTVHPSTSITRNFQVHLKTSGDWCWSSHDVVDTFGSGSHTGNETLDIDTLNTYISQICHSLSYLISFLLCLTFYEQKLVNCFYQQQMLLLLSVELLSQWKLGTKLHCFSSLGCHNKEILHSVKFHPPCPINGYLGLIHQPMRFNSASIWNHKLQVSSCDEHVLLWKIEILRWRCSSSQHLLHLNFK